PPGGERLLLRGRRAARTDEGGEARLEPGQVGVAVRERALELRLRFLRRVGLEDAALGLDDLPQCPEGDPLPVGKTAPLTPTDEPWTIVVVGEQLGTEAALAPPRLAHDRHQLAGALLRRALKGANQQRPLELPAYERSRVRAGDVRAEAGARGERAVEGK